MNKNMAFGLIAILVVAGAYYVGTTSKNVPEQSGNTQITQTPTNTQEQLPVKQPTPPAPTNTQTKTVATIEEVQTCSQQSKAQFDSEMSAVTQNGLYPIQGTWNYTNHLNAKQAKCFRVEILDGNAGTAYAGFGEGLYNVYENKSIASFNQTDSNHVAICSINGLYGCTKAQFSAFLNSEMESTSY
jgi:glucan-binding YG repeat protein